MGILRQSHPYHTNNSGKGHSRNLCHLDGISFKLLERLEAKVVDEEVVVVEVTRLICEKSNLVVETLIVVKRKFWDPQNVFDGTASNRTVGYDGQNFTSNDTKYMNTNIWLVKRNL
jgi:hypothetical protein